MRRYFKNISRKKIYSLGKFANSKSIIKTVENHKKESTTQNKKVTLASKETPPFFLKLLNPS